jgi:hypothetical protein
LNNSLLLISTILINLYFMIWNKNFLFNLQHIRMKKGKIIIVQIWMFKLNHK